MAERTAWDYLHTLESLGNLTISPSTKYTVVSLIKWDFFQSRDEKPARKVYHDVTRKVYHDVTQNKEYIENLKEKKEKALPSEEIDESEYW